MSKYWLLNYVLIGAIVAGIGCASGPSATDDAERAEAGPQEQVDDDVDNDTAGDDSPVDTSVAEAQLELPGPLVGADWLEDNLTSPDLALIHVGRDRQAWEEAHIPGQVYIDFSDIVVGSFEEGFYSPPAAEVRDVFEEAGVADNRRVVITGDLDGLMATRAWMTLDILGLGDQAALLDGGLPQWRDQGYSVNDTAVVPEAGTITARADDSNVWDADDVLEILDEPGYALIDLRPAAEYEGETLGDGVARGGHIPGAINLFWKDTLQVGDRPLLMSRQAIADKLSDAGVADDDVLVVYCRTGMQASFGYFLGHYLDREVRVYDGSFVDWTSDDERPVE